MSAPVRWAPMPAACTECHSLWRARLEALRAVTADHEAELVEAFVCGWRHEGDLWLRYREEREARHAALVQP